MPGPVSRSIFRFFSFYLIPVSHPRALRKGANATARNALAIPRPATITLATLHRPFSRGDTILLWVFFTFIFFLSLYHFPCPLLLRPSTRVSSSHTKLVIILFQSRRRSCTPPQTAHVAVRSGCCCCSLSPPCTHVHCVHTRQRRDQR